MKFKYKIVAPIPSLKSPDISAPIGNSCTGPKKGDTPFLSKNRSNFLDIGADGETQGISVRYLKKILIENGRRVVKSKNNPFKSDGGGDKFTVTIKNGKITKMVDFNGNKISHKGYTPGILGLNHKSDGNFTV